MVRKTKEETEQTYHALLDAAIQLFTRQGVARTTLNEIAKEANMTRGAVYWHFDNKDAVIRALWDRNACIVHQHFSDSLNVLCESVNAGQCVRQTLKSSIRALMSDEKAGQVIRIVFHNVEFTDEKTELQEFLCLKIANILDMLEVVFQSLADGGALKVQHSPRLLSRSLMAYIRGLLDMQFVPMDSGVDLEQDGDVYVDLYLDAVLAD